MSTLAITLIDKKGKGLIPLWEPGVEVVTTKAGCASNYSSAVEWVAMKTSFYGVSNEAPHHYKTRLQGEAVFS